MFKIRRFLSLASLWISAGATALLISCATFHSTHIPTPAESTQVPTWSNDDYNFFLHGSMSTECVPETVLRAFIKTYPLSSTVGSEAWNSRDLKSRPH